MSDNIKLPELGEMTLHMWQNCLVHYNKELTKRAHRIEKLETALREITWIATPDHEEARHKATEIARNALEKKDE